MIKEIILESVEALTVLDKANAMKGGTRQSKVRMIIGDSVLRRSVGKSLLSETAFRYEDDQGNVLPDSIGGVFRSTPNPQTGWAGFDVKAISQSINGLLPTEDNIEDRFDAEITVYARQKFASDWGIDASSGLIEIVPE